MRLVLTVWAYTSCHRLVSSGRVRLVLTVFSLYMYIMSLPGLKWASEVGSDCIQLIHHVTAWSQVGEWVWFLLYSAYTSCHRLVSSGRVRLVLTVFSLYIMSPPGLKWASEVGSYCIQLIHHVTAWSQVGEWGWFGLYSAYTSCHRLVSSGWVRLVLTVFSLNIMSPPGLKWASEVDSYCIQLIHHVTAWSQVGEWGWFLLYSAYTSCHRLVSSGRVMLVLTVFSLYIMSPPGLNWASEVGSYCMSLYIMSPPGLKWASEVGSYRIQLIHHVTAWSQVGEWGWFLLYSAYTSCHPLVSGGRVRLVLTVFSLYIMSPPGLKWASEVGSYCIQLIHHVTAWSQVGEWRRPWWRH